MKMKSTLKYLLALIIMGSINVLYAQDLSIERDKKGKVGLVNQSGKFVIKPQYDEIGIFEKGIAKVRIKNKYGFINDKGKEILKPQFSIVEEFVNGAARVCIGAQMNKKTEELEGGKWGYINDEGQILIKPAYDDIDYFNEFNIAKTKKGKTFGWVSRYGKELIKPQYTQIGEIIDGMARICKGGKIKNNKIENGKWGFVDDGGRIIIKPKYLSAGEFKEGVAWVGKNETYTYINKQGMEICEGSFTNNDANNGIVILGKSISKKQSKTGKKGRYFGIMNLQGTILEDLVFAEIKMNDLNWAQALDLSDNQSYFLHNENGKITKLKSGTLQINFKNEVERYVVDGKNGYVKKDGTIVIAPKYTSLGEFSDLTYASEDNSRFGYLSKTGEVAIPFEYDQVTIFNEGYGTVRKGSNWSVIDKNNSTVLSMKVDSLGVYSEGVIPALKDKKAGFISLSGKEVIPFSYESTSPMHKGKFNYKEKEKWGIKDAQEKVLLSPTYNSIADFYDEFGNKIIIRDNKSGLVNSEEKEILAPGFDLITLDPQYKFYTVMRSITGNENADVKSMLETFSQAVNNAQKKTQKKDAPAWQPEKLFGAVNSAGTIIIEPCCILPPDKAYETIIIKHGQKHASANDIKYLSEHLEYYITNYNRFKVHEVIPEELWEY